METVAQAVISAVVTGLISGTLTGMAAYAAIRVELRWLRRDVDHAHERIERIERREALIHSQT